MKIITELIELLKIDHFEKGVITTEDVICRHQQLLNKMLNRVREPSYNFYRAGEVLDSKEGYHFILLREFYSKPIKRIDRAQYNQFERLIDGVGLLEPNRKFNRKEIDEIEVIMKRFQKLFHTNKL